MVGHRNKIGPGEIRTTPGQTKHSITVKEGKLFDFSSDNNDDETETTDSDAHLAIRAVD